VEFGILDVHFASAAFGADASLSQNPTGLLVEINGTETGI